MFYNKSLPVVTLAVVAVERFLSVQCQKKKIADVKVSENPLPASLLPDLWVHWQGT